MKCPKCGREMRRVSARESSEGLILTYRCRDGRCPGSQGEQTVRVAGSGGKAETEE